MKRAWQIFVAPGDETEPLPIERSPWHDERWVSLPKEHWNLILDFAEMFDPTSAEKLRLLSHPTDNNDYDYVHASLEEVKTLLPFMEDLADKIEHAPPLVAVVTAEIPDQYVNEEHMRMLKAVAAVFQEALRLRQPFRAWTE